MPRRRPPLPIVFTGIPADRCDEFWPLIEPILLRVIARTEGRHSWLSVKNAIRDRHWQLWAAFSDATMTRCIAAMTSQILTYSTGVTELEVTLAAGDVIPACLPCLDVVGAWAKSQGCQAMTLNGRKGWGKMLPSYEESAVILRKSL